MDLVTQNTKYLIYNLYYIIVTLLFIFSFTDIVGNNTKFTGKYLTLVSSRVWILIGILSLFILLKLDSYVGILLMLLLILLFTNNKIIKNKICKDCHKEEQQNDVSRMSFTNITNIDDRNKTINNLIIQIKKQNVNSDTDLGINYYNYIYDKYFNNDEILDKLTQKESRQLISNMKSNFIIPYDIIEDEKLQNELPMRYMRDNL
jgi:hypothetical protein